MLVTSGVFPIMDMEDLSGLMGSRPPRATDFSIAAIIGRSGRNMEAALKSKGKRAAGESNMRPLGSMVDSPESLTTEGGLKDEMLLMDGRDSPDIPSSTSDSRDTIEVVHSEESDLKSDNGRGSPAAGKSNSGRSTGSPVEKAAPKNPLLQENCNCEELRHVVCHLETKELWDKFHDLGTEMIITKSGRSLIIVMGTAGIRCQREICSRSS